MGAREGAECTAPLIVTDRGVVGCSRSLTHVDPVLALTALVPASVVSWAPLR